MFFQEEAMNNSTSTAALLAFAFKSVKSTYDPKESPLSDPESLALVKI